MSAPWLRYFCCDALSGVQYAAPEAEERTRWRQQPSSEHPPADTKEGLAVRVGGLLAFGLAGLTPAPDPSGGGRAPSAEYERERLEGRPLPPKNAKK